MNKKKILKKLKYFLKFMPDKLYLDLYYYAQFKKKINWNNPQTYNEKLNWLKLNDRNELYTVLVDKFESKEYVKKIIGEEYIIPTLGVWNSYDEIDFSSLPNEFVLKCTHDSEGLAIVKDKKNMDNKIIKKNINNALKYNFYYIGREYPYKSVNPRIIAEKYMEDDKYKELRDYKFFCFDGSPKMMFVATGRSKGKTCFDFYDMNFNHLNIVQHYPNSKDVIEKPMNFELMIELAKKLSKDFKHVRVDFYEVNGKVYFGELTFYHFSGLQPFANEEWDYKIGDYIDLKK